jgi:hypothetical protein
MILFVNNNRGILFLATEVIVSVGRFLKITVLSVTEYISQVLTVEDSNGTC